MKREDSVKIKVVLLGFLFLLGFMTYGGFYFNAGIIIEKNGLEGNEVKIRGSYDVMTARTISGNDGWETLAGAEEWCHEDSGTYIIENVTFSVPSIPASPLMIVNSDVDFIIRNCTFLNSTYNYIEDGDIFHAGIKLANVTNGMIQNNTIVNNTLGIYADHLCKDITIAENNLLNNIGEAIYLMGEYFTIAENVMEKSGIRIHGDLLKTLTNSKTHNIATTNTLNGKTIYYLVNETGVASSIFSAGEPGQVLAVNVNSSTFSGLDMEGGSIAFQLIYCEDNIISENDFTLVRGTTIGAGILIEGGRNNTITKNNFTNCRDGIRVSRTTDTIITENNFLNNTAGVHGYKITIEEYNNTIDSNYFNGNVLGIHLDQTQNWTVQGNEIESDNVSIGIQVGTATINCQIIGNTLYSSGVNLSTFSMGIFLTQSGGINLTGNNISNYYYGIRNTMYSTNNNISLNTIVNNTFCGIEISSYSNYVALTNNNLTNNGNFSIYANINNYLTISQNNASYNNGTGIHVFRCDNTDILNNYVYNNTEYGIYLDRSANCKINYNTLENNTICIGVHQDSCPGLEAIGNTCDWTPLDPVGGGGEGIIPGYGLFFIIGIIGVISIILLKRRNNNIKLV